MSVVDDVKVWMRKMGYDGKIPESLPKICTPSTTFIWEQIISNVKPRQEVANIRRNIIIRRLREKPLEQQHEFSFPIKEIQAHIKRQELEKRIKMLESVIEEKEATLDDRLKQNKMSYITLNQLKQKIKENRQSTYFMEIKSKIFEDDIHRAQEMLTLARNLTPVEMEENSNGDEITEILQKCAEKLQKLTEETNTSNKRITYNSSSSILNRSVSVSSMRLFNTPSRTKGRNLSKYIDMSRTLTKTARDKQRISNKENITVKSVNLLNTESEKSNKRESLGLLSSSHLNFSDEFDNVFLQPPRIEQLCNSTQKSCSVLEPNKNDTILGKLCNVKDVKETLKQTLYTNNRQLILKSCENIYEILLSEVRNLTFGCNTYNHSGEGQEDLNKLYFLHVKTELEKDRLRAGLKKMRETIRKHKKDVYCSLSTLPKHDELRKIFDLQFEEAELNASNNFLCKQLNSMRKIGSNNEMQVVSTKVAKVKDEICHVIDFIRDLIENVHKVFEYIKNTRDEATASVRQLGPYIFDLSWANLLQEQVYSEEIKTFESFPLEYSRKLSQKNIYSTTVPSDIDLHSSDNLEIITTIIDKPYSPPEDIILNLLRLKTKLNLLKSIETKPENVDYCKYSSEELFQREDLGTLTDKLNSLMYSSSVKETLSAPDQMKEITKLWIEMPVKNFISDEILVDGHNYKFYENLFDRYYSNL